MIKVNAFEIHNSLMHIELDIIGRYIIGPAREVAQVRKIICIKKIPGNNQPFPCYLRAV